MAVRGTFITRIASSWRHAHALARATSSNNMRFRFHLARGGRSPDTIWLQKKLTHDGAFAGRKLSSMTVLCSMYREHIAKNTGHSVKARHAMRARAPFSSLGHRCSFVSSLEGPETGVNCQLLVDVHGRTQPILQWTNSRRHASVWSFANGFLSERECSVQSEIPTYKYGGID